MAALLTLVAVNTLLFLGLSVAKFAPWPEPVHPCTLRERAQESDVSGPAAVSIRQDLLLRVTVAMHHARRTGASASHTTRMTRS